MGDFLLKVFTIVVFVVGGVVGLWWYSPSEVCASMIEDKWYGDGATCPAYYESGYQPCIIEGGRTSAYCLDGKYGDGKYKVFDVTQLENGELSSRGDMWGSDLILSCGEHNPFCSIWQRD